MDLYTAERVHLERQKEMVTEAERRARLLPRRRPGQTRHWLADSLRAAADRIDGRVLPRIA